MNRGFCGIAFFEPKFEENIGTAIRNAHCFGADFICVIGARYKKQASDTTKAHKHIPFYHYKDLKDFFAHLPEDTEVLTIEVDGEDILRFKHPERAIYLFGGEDRTVPKNPTRRLSIPTSYCLNMAVTSGIVLYDRKVKSSPYNN